jgi:cytochrome P450
MATEREEIDRAVEEFYEYAEALVRSRRDSTRRRPHLQADRRRRGGRALSDVECINLVFNVLVGGVDTSQSQLAHAIRLLAEHPEQWEMLVADPSLADQAVEEALRYEPITPFTARITTEEITFRDITFPEDTIVMVCAFTGNRDLGDDGDGEEDRFDIAVDRGRARALTFGAGVHYCLGANLARAELQEGLTFLAQRMHGLQLDGEPVFESVNGIYGLAELPISFTL